MSISAVAAPLPTPVAGTFRTRFSTRTPQRPGRYTPGSMLVIIPGSIAIAGSATTREIVCGPSCTFRK